MQSDSDETPSPSTARVWWTSFGVLTLLGLVWAVASPIMASPDETVHAIKAAAIVRGELIGDETVVRQHDPAVLNKVTSALDVPAAYAALVVVPSCYAFREAITADCSPGVGDDVGAARAEVYVGRYPPVPYAVLGVPTLVLPPRAAVWTMRLLSCLAVAALLACAVTAVRDLDRRGLLSAGLLLAVTPMTMFIGTSINPNGVEVAAAIAAWPSLLVLIDRAGRVARGQAVRAAVTLGVLALARPLSPGFAVVIVATVLAMTATRERLAALWRQRTVRRATFATVAVVGAATAWVVAVRAFDTFQGYPLPDLTRGEIVRGSLGELPDRMRQVVGVFGWLDTPLHPLVVTLWWLAIAAVVVTGLVSGTWRARIVLVAAVVGSAALPTAAELLSAATIGYGWQGRYSMPLVLGIPLLAAYAAERSGRLPARATRAAAVGTAVLTAGIMLFALGTSARRYAVGADRPPWAFLEADARWRPAIGSWAFAVAAAVACAVYLAGALVLIRDVTRRGARGGAQATTGRTTPRASNASTSAAASGELQ